uniref:Transposase Tc1-like domain-containing protein n=1 Tax=Oncorhynchus mykiss TaxID=8022 RepID=A0A8K9UEY6_ONCMY
MVTCKETRAVIIALHKKGFTGKDIAASKIAPKSTIYQIIKNFKESGSIVVKKASGRPRKSSKRQDRLLKLIQLRDRGTTSTALAQEWQQAGVSASARTVRRCLLKDGLVSRAVKKSLLSRKNIRDRLIFCKRYRDWTAEDWGKVIFSDESPFRLFGASRKKLVRTRQGERHHQSCVMPTVKHPETIHVWGCFSAKGVDSLKILPKNTAMNKEWYQHILREQLLPTIQVQFGDEQCLFQHAGAPCHKAKVITMWLREQNIDILGPWPGNSPDLNPIENLWSLEYVDIYKYLGVWLDCKLSFQTHIKHLQSKIKSRVGFLFRNKASFTHAAKLTLVKLTILPILDFGDVIYKMASNTLLSKLDAVYHSAIRFVTKAPYTTHHCDLYALVGWPSLHIRRQTHWLQVIYKSMLGKAPPYLSSLVTMATPIRSTRSSRCISLIIPKANTSFGRLSFQYSVACDWNELQKSLKLETFISLTNFKHQLSEQLTDRCSCT